MIEDKRCGDVIWEEKKNTRCYKREGALIMERGQNKAAHR